MSDEIVVTIEEQFRHRKGRINDNVSKIQESYMQIGEDLSWIKQETAYKVDGHQTFDDFVKAEWGISGDYGRRLIQGYNTSLNISQSAHGQIVNEGTNGLVMPTSERQTRPLNEFDKEPEVQAEIWNQAVEDAGGKVPTAAQVTQAVDNYKTPPPDDTPPTNSFELSFDFPDTIESLDDEDAAEMIDDVEPTGFDYKRDNKRNQKADPDTPSDRDNCQTPGYGIVPILPYVSEDVVIWEPAVGEGYLAEALRKNRRQVVTSGVEENFFEYEPDHFDVIVTNPPFSIKKLWMERCFEFGKPFALLLQSEWIATQECAGFFEEHGLEYIQPLPRIDFKMPNKGWDGKGSHFPSIWITHGLNVGQPFSYVYITDVVARFKQWVRDGGDPMQFCLY